MCGSYYSKRFAISLKDLNIGAQFYIQDEIIRCINLELLNFKNMSGLFWEISGPCPKPLEELICQWMENYARKKVDDSVGLPMEQYLPTFAYETLLQIIRIPFGKTVSYQELARSVGKPNGQRAVGNVCAINPFPLVIPCHRVIAKSGRLGGYSSGVEIKRHLLEFEAALG